MKLTPSNLCSVVVSNKIMVFSTRYRRNSLTNTSLKVSDTDNNIVLSIFIFQNAVHECQQTSWRTKALFNNLPFPYSTQLLRWVRKYKYSMLNNDLASTNFQATLTSYL